MTILGLVPGTIDQGRGSLAQTTSSMIRPVWINPSAIIKAFSLGIVANSSNLDEVKAIIRSDRKLRRSAEGWAASVLLQALKQRDKISYFLRPNPVEHEAPDFFGVGLFIEKDLIRGFSKDIEVFTLTKEGDLDLVDEIRKKVAKRYSRETVLLCHIIKEGFKKNLGEIHEEIKELNPRNEIWVVGGAANEQQLVAQVSPSLEAYSVDLLPILSEEFGDSNPAFFEELPLKKLPRGTSIKFEKLGRSTLLMPDLTFPGDQ